MNRTPINRRINARDNRNWRWEKEKPVVRATGSKIQKRFQQPPKRLNRIEG